MSAISKLNHFPINPFYRTFASSVDVYKAPHRNFSSDRNFSSVKSALQPKENVSEIGDLSSKQCSATFHLENELASKVQHAANGIVFPKKTGSESVAVKKRELKNDLDESYKCKMQEILLRGVLTEDVMKSSADILCAKGIDFKVLPEVLHACASDCVKNMDEITANSVLNIFDQFIEGDLWKSSFNEKGFRINKAAKEGSVSKLISAIENFNETFKFVIEMSIDHVYGQPML